MTPTEKIDTRIAQQSAIPERVLALLKASDEAVLLVDAEAARVIAANAAGCLLLGCRGPRFPVTLDSSMPAVGTLRAIARDGAGGAAEVPLVFWAADQARSIVAKVEAVSTETTALLLVTALPVVSQVAARDPRFASPYGPSGIDLAQLAHELKTPLSAIAAASEIMKEGRFGPIDNERYAGYVADIHQSARHALDLISRMLDRKVEQAEAATAELFFEPIDLAKLVEVCISSVGPLAAAKTLSVVNESEARAALVAADETATKQIVLNLLTNAIKFTPVGGRITIKTVRNRTGAVSLAIEDTGPGMTGEEIAHALRPVPLEIPEPREGGGLGLGLPLSRSLAEAMGAKLTLDSDPGRGLRVRLIFPAPTRVAERPLVTK